tara:strand:- start:1608 stop:2024 length:417 start_codon:yes stop_codon:yes gene_type:complete
MENWRRFKILIEEGAQGPTPEYLDSAHKAALASGIKKYPKFKHFISKATMDPKYGSLPDDWGAWYSKAGGNQIGRVTKDRDDVMEELSRIKDEDERHALIRILLHYNNKLKKKEGIVRDDLKNLPGRITPYRRGLAKI